MRSGTESLDTEEFDNLLLRSDKIALNRSHKRILAQVNEFNHDQTWYTRVDKPMVRQQQVNVISSTLLVRGRLWVHITNEDSMVRPNSLKTKADGQLQINFIQAPRPTPGKASRQIQPRLVNNKLGWEAS